MPLSSLDRELLRAAIDRTTGRLKVELFFGPTRKGHAEPATAEQVAAHAAWKAQWEALREQGWENGWLTTDFDGSDTPVQGTPPNWVYDESEEDFRARREEWEASRPTNPDGTVTFPVHKRQDEQE